MLSPKARELLELQRRKYLASLPAKKDRISGYWNDLLTRGWEASVADALKTEIHRLAGSAGSYGLERVGAVALGLDRLLAAGPGGGPDLPEIGRHIVELEKALDQATP